MPTILLIRHGENDSIGKRLVGRLPGVHLNEKGRRQAETIAEYLGNAPVKAIYSSPLERALETAKPLAERLNLPVQTRPGLIEVDYGEWEGKTYKQLYRLNLWKTALKNPAEMYFPGGESIPEVQQRARRELEAIVAAHAPEEVAVCFTHGDIIRLCIAHFLRMSINDYHRLCVSTASLTIIQVHENFIRLPHINQVVNFAWPAFQEENFPKK